MLLRASRVAMVVLLASAVSAGGAVDRSVHIGILLPPDEVAAAAMRRGADLAAETDGCVLHFVGTEGDGPWSGHAARVVRLRYEHGVDGLVAPAHRRLAHAAAQVSTRARLPLQVLAGTDALTRIPVPWIERVVPGEREVLAALLRATARGVSPATVTDTRDEGSRLARRLSRAYRRAGRKAVATLFCDGSPRSVRRVARQLADDRTVLLATAPTTTLALLTELNRRRWKGVRLVGPAVDAAWLAAADATAARGAIAVRRFAPGDGEGARDFAALYRRRFAAEAPWEAAATFDAVRRLVGRKTGTPPDSSNRTHRVRLVRIGLAGRLDPLDPKQEAR